MKCSNRTSIKKDSKRRQNMTPKEMQEKAMRFFDENLH
jgi:hypothetical protein